MSSKKKQAELREEKDWEKIDHAVVKSENFLEKYSKQILIIIAAFVAIACIYLAYKQFYLEPKTEEAQKAMYKGESLFRNGEDSLALYGNGNDFIGFEAIADQYGSTDAGKLAKAYAGLCYAQLGKYEKALDYLKGYSANDKLFTHLVNGAIGDCLVNTGKAQEAVSYFEKGAKGADNVIHSPILYKKAGLIYRDLGNYDKVIEVFTIIQNKYANSPLTPEAKKYIEEAQILKAAK